MEVTFLWRHIMALRLTKIIPFLFVWIWSTGFIGAKYALPYIEPFFLLEVRFFLVIVIFIGLVLALKKRWPQKRDQVMQMIIGALIHGIYLGGVFFAIKQGVPAGITAIFVGLHPILTAFLAWLMLRQSLNVTQLMGLALGFVGIVLVILGSADMQSGDVTILGIIACIAALIAISLGSILQRLYAKDVPLVSGTTYQYIGAFIVILPMTLLLEDQTFIPTPELFLSLAWLVLALSLLGILLLMYMIREGEVAKVASYFYLVPPATVVQAWFLFDEVLSIQSILGCALAVIAVYMVANQSKQK